MKAKLLQTCKIVTKSKLRASLGFGVRCQTGFEQVYTNKNIDLPTVYMSTWVFFLVNHFLLHAVTAQVVHYVENLKNSFIPYTTI